MSISDRNNQIIRLFEKPIHFDYFKIIQLIKNHSNQFDFKNDLISHDSLS